MHWETKKEIMLYTFYFDIYFIAGVWNQICNISKKNACIVSVEFIEFSWTKPLFQKRPHILFQSLP